MEVLKLVLGGHVCSVHSSLLSRQISNLPKDYEIMTIGWDKHTEFKG